MAAFGRYMPLIFSSHAWLLPMIAFVYGSMVGSFLNVVAYRVPLIRHRRATQVALTDPTVLDEPPLTLSIPSSHCPFCKAAIPVYLNVPILGWCFTLGKCFRCKTDIPLRYPMVEIAVATTTALSVLAGGAQAQSIGLVATLMLGWTFVLLDRSTSAQCGITSSDGSIPHGLVWSSIFAGVIMTLLQISPIHPLLLISGLAIGMIDYWLAKNRADVGAGPWFGCAMGALTGPVGPIIYIAARAGRAQDNELSDRAVVLSVNLGWAFTALLALYNQG